MEDLITRIDDLEQNTSDSFDAVNSDIGDLSQQADDNQPLVGQLDFPLNQDSIDRIKEVFPTGTATLVAGTVTVNDTRIGANSVIFYSVTTPGGTQGSISYSLSTGTVTFISTSATDTSTVAYVIF